MSGSEVASLPSATTIARKLRDVVISMHKSGDTDNLTIKRVRNRVEEQLGLAHGFFKSDEIWKPRSHDLIHEAVEKFCGDKTEPEPSPPPTPKANATAKRKVASDEPRGVKRVAIAPSKKPPKRQKTALSDDKSHLPSDTESDRPKRLVQRRRKVVLDDDEEKDNALHNGTTHSHADRHEVDAGDEAGVSMARLEEDVTKEDGIESDMSSLIDEEPASKRKRQKKTSSEKTTKAKPGAKSTKSAKVGDPDTAEIKRLQGWLVKCGIRKVWSKELARYDTPKEKIKHLKGMLRDAGMEGKFSNEKASAIKEQREFAKDLEAIQEGAKYWGQVAEPEGGGRPTRRAAARAPKKLVVSDPDDSEDGERDEGQYSVGHQPKDESENDSESDSSDEVEEGDSANDSD